MKMNFWGNQSWSNTFHQGFPKGKYEPKRGMWNVHRSATISRNMTLTTSKFSAWVTS